MKIYVGKILARCLRCGGDDWVLADAARSFSIFTDLKCSQCGLVENYADLALKAPLEDDDTSGPK